MDDPDDEGIRSFADSVHRLLAEQIEQLQLGGFYRAGRTSIKGGNGTEFIFAGLRHNVSKIKSFEGVDIVWVEEGQNLRLLYGEIRGFIEREPLPENMGSRGIVEVRS